MPRILHSLALPALLLLLLPACSGAPDAETDTSHADEAAEVAKTTIIHAGDRAPDIELDLLGGGVFELKQHRGQVVLVNFFATWCAPCKAEMPYLQAQVWERFRGPDFTMVSIAREEDAVEVAPFVAERELTWPFAFDPLRKTFGAYASAYIPRNFVVDREGVVLYQSQGFEQEEFADMIEVIEKELAR